MIKSYQDFSNNDDFIRILSEIDNMSNGNGLLRIFLSSSDIKICNKMVKLGLLDKGINDAKHGTTVFFITREGENYLENI